LLLDKSQGITMNDRKIKPAFFWNTHLPLVSYLFRLCYPN
jgi:hypothetical protein